VVALQAEFADRLQQHVSAIDVRLDESVRLRQRAVHVRLRGKVDDGVDVVPRDRVAHRGSVADVPLHKRKALVAPHVLQVDQVAGIGEFVVDGHAVVRVLAQHIVHIVGADEPGPASDHQVAHGILL